MPAELAYVLANRRVMAFEGTGEYPPADEHDLCEDRSPRQQPRPATRRIGQRRPPYRSKRKRYVAQHGPMLTHPALTLPRPRLPEDRGNSLLRPFRQFLRSTAVLIPHEHKRTAAQRASAFSSTFTIFATGRGPALPGVPRHPLTPTAIQSGRLVSKPATTGNSSPPRSICGPSAPAYAIPHTRMLIWGVQARRPTRGKSNPSWSTRSPWSACGTQRRVASHPPSPAARSAKLETFRSDQRAGRPLLPLNTLLLWLLLVSRCMWISMRRSRRSCALTPLRRMSARVRSSIGRSARMTCAR